MLKGLIVVAAAAAVYAFYLEIRRGRAFWKLVEWLKAERSTEWESVHQGRAKLPNSVSRLHRGRLANDAEFLERYDAVTRRGRQMAIAVSVGSAAVVALLAGTTMFDWSF